MLPLYKDHIEPSDKGNKALYFDKFYHWSFFGEARTKEEKATRKKEKESFLKDFKKLCGNPSEIEASALRHFELISSLEGQIKAYTNEWHFVTGMGIDHPLENGMAWHHTLGVPYIAGSGVKGMLRAYCEVWQGWDKSKIERIFGSSADAKEPSTGSYIFFDALPIKQVQLTPDVMTPHMGKWYEDGGKVQHDHNNTPADWHAPVPVTFLAVKSCTLLFGIAPRTKTYDKEELSELMERLTEALEWIGAGAKTAAGYGRFKSVSSKFDTMAEEKKKELNALEKQNSLNKLSPLDRKFEEFKGQRATLIKLLQKGEFGEESKEAALRIKAEMVKAGKWVEKSAKKNPAKDFDHQDTLAVMKFL